MPAQSSGRSRAEAVSRGKMFINATMGWLPGFPAGQSAGKIQWSHIPHKGIPTIQRYELSRQHIHEATLTWSKLTRRFPNALPLIIENHQFWAETLTKLLMVLKDAIHDGISLPLFWQDSETKLKNLDEYPPLAARIAANSKLQSIFQALSWYTIFTPDQFVIAVRWVLQKIEIIEFVILESTPQEAIEMVFVLWHAYRVEKNSAIINNLFAILISWSKEATLPFGLPEYIEYRFREADKKSEQYWQQQAKRRFSAVETYKRFDITELKNYFIKTLTSESHSTILNSWQIFCACADKIPLTEWEKWCKEASLLVKELDQIISPEIRRKRQYTKDARTTQLQFLDNALSNAPYYVDLPELIQYINYLIHDPSLCSIVAEIIVHYKPTIIEQPNTFQLLSSLLYAANYNRPLSIAFLNVARDFHIRHPQIRSQVEMFTETVVVNRISEELFAPICHVFAEIDWITQNTPTYIYVDFIESLLKVRKDVRQVSLDYLEIYKQSKFHSELQAFDLSTIVNAHELDQNTGSFATLLLQCNVLLEDNNLGNYLVKIDRIFKKLGYQGVVRHQLLENKTTDLKLLANKLNSLGLADVEVEKLVSFPEATNSESWIEKYPKRFEPLLVQLNNISSNAQRVAKRVLQSDYPDIETMHEEVRSLESLIIQNTGDEKLQKRLLNLQLRLQSPIEPSLERQATLFEKLEQLLQHELFAWLNQQFDHKLREIYQERIGSFTASVDFKQERIMTLLSAINQLEPEYRALAATILNKRLNQTELSHTEWHLHDHPNNQAFIHKIEQMGIDCQPWIHPSPAKCLSDANGRSIFISIEQDPLETLFMGGYFKTCLSPGAFNFYSAIVNTVDINKQVLFARDEDGNVLGRCLIALTAHGHILVFRAYCHDPQLGFAEIVKNFVIDLSKQMGTLIASSGEVPPLLASNWYDDGAIDIEGRFLFLKHNSTFRNSLGSISLDSLVPTLQQLFDPLPLNELTLPIILSIAEFQNRPELLVPLLPFIQNCNYLPDTIWEDIFRLACAAQLTDVMQQVAEQRIMPAISKTYRRYRRWYIDYDILKLLARLLPKDVIKVLKQTRNPKIHRELDEPKYRIDILLIAYNMLGNTRKVAQLERSILKDQTKS